MSEQDQSADIFVYEDDFALAREIAMACAAHGLKAALLADEAELQDRVRTGSARVLVMDRMVHGVDSVTIIERLRASAQRVPVLVISSLATVDDRIRGLKSGGDDYLVKPFAMGELIARVEALARRTADTRTTQLTVGPLALDLIHRTATRNGRPIALLPREFSLLEYFMRHAGQTVTRAMLLEDVWNYKATTQTNVVDVHVGNLRRKIEVDGENKLIASVRGVGFRLSAAEP